MEGGELKCSPEDEEEPLMVRPLAGVRLVDAPILLLVFFHKAIREEFAELRFLAVEALETGSDSRDLVLDLHRRFEFLKLVYKYHCSAEDEVIFQALDGYTKNVVCTYSLEHKSIDDLFDSISRCLIVLTNEDANISETFQELVFCIGTTQTIICQHMVKEEKQVFPLLMQQFSPKEQALLVWQFMCSVPMMLLENFLRWMTSFLSPDEQVGVMHCIEEVLPIETLLQKVVISWLAKKKPFFGTGDKYEKGGESPYELFNSKDMLKLHLSKSHSGEEQLKNCYSIHTNNTGSQNVIDGIHLWHSALKRGLKEILEELYQIRGSNSFSTLASVTAQLKFFADVLIFYSNALDKIVYTMVNELAKSFLIPSYKKFMDESQIEGLQKLLYCKVQIGAPLSNFVEKLCMGLELFVRDTGKHLVFLEIEVFPFISKNCSHEFQQWLLYTSLNMMPFGLLRCTVTWFSAHLSEDEYKLILYSIEQGGPVAYKSFKSLLYEWVRIGYSGKISIEKFRKDLQEMFNSRNSFLSQQIKEDSEFPSLPNDIQSWDRSNPLPLEPNSDIKAKNSVSNSLSSSFNTAEKYGASYFSGINLHLFFPQLLKNIPSLSKFPAGPSAAGTYFNLGSRPIDFIFFFHNALKKDLEYLVFVSANLAENCGLLADFHRCFHLLQFLYQIHSESEDEIAFPALELKGKLRNISHSYTIDHKLEVEHFNKISFILDKISELDVSVSGGNADSLDQRRLLRYHQLCVKLQDMCKSMHKMLCDHVDREEIELWPLFRECFSIEEQETIIGRILGRTRAEILQEMIPWLMASLTLDEQNATMSLWRKATKNTMFDEWLGEWWDGMKRYDIAKVEEEPNVPPSWTADPLEVVSTYFLKEGFVNRGNLCNKGVEFPENDLSVYNSEPSGTLIVDDRARISDENRYGHQSSDCTKFAGEVDKMRCNEIAEVTDEADKRGQDVKVSPKFRHQEHLLIMSQEELEAAIRRVSRDSTLDPRKKSYIIQNLLMSRWIITQQRSHSEVAVSSDEEEVPGRSPSYRDPPNSTFGCKHYKRNCKILAACCNKLYACIRCHDDMADHSINRKSITNMMCMKCLVIQPISPTCSTVSCSNLSMARYYCRICKLFDDEREIYHCPYCNLCRVGKGLGVDYFHCMNCNACMSRSLSVHICREKCLEENCPICHEYIFTSSAPVKALPCGHLMHSACFQDYTCTHYTCPICSKSLGDMQVYFGMLDALLAEQKIPEYFGQTQVILCNDCEKRGSASFHWLYHKCSYCGSYNTRLL